MPPRQREEKCTAREPRVGTQCGEGARRHHRAEGGPSGARDTAEREATFAREGGTG